MPLGVSDKSVLDFVNKTVPAVGVVAGIDGSAYKTGSDDNRNSSDTTVVLLEIDL
jgi:hypothetical protein